MRDLYVIRHTIPDFYGNRTEPDMRQELHHMFDGVFPEIAKSIPVLLRKMRRIDGVLVTCTCIDKNTLEPDKDTFCQFCHGERYLWDEIWVDTFKVDATGRTVGTLSEKMIGPGLMNEPTIIFYLRSRIDITIEDRIIQVVLNEAGQPVRPYRRQKLYRIGNLVDFRSDNGKLEYWRVETYSEKRKFLNGYNI